MKQVIQNYRTGELELAEVPIPVCSSNNILVKNYASLISIGTERSIIELGKKSLLGKARARPDLVKRFIDKGKKEGFLKTFQEALGRLDNPSSLGYSSAGIVIETGRNIHRYSPGDRVACIGAGYASHAEYITLPENLCCKIPDTMTFEEASFGMLGIIALHGIRCTKSTFGESVAVIGLGLLGLLTVQLLKAYGCEVFGFDINQMKVDIAKTLGINHVFTDGEKFKNSVERLTNGYGADAVIITATTKSDTPVNLAIELSRYRGRIVLVGVADIHPQRNEMWHKEVDIIVSKAGGPGTFDPYYENKGIDYPIGHIRWTENRNLQEFMRLISEGKIDVKPLISHRFKIDDAENIYRDMLENKRGPYIGVVLQYPDKSSDVNSYKLLERTIFLKTSQQITNLSQINVGVIGAGLFGKALLLPALKEIKNIRLHTLSTSTGANVLHTGRKYNFEKIATDYHEIMKNEEINTVIILAPHSLHARMVIDALNTGKNVFVEKPLCINEKEFKDIVSLYESLIKNGQAPMLMVGYNRRFSPHSAKAKECLLSHKDPLIMHYRINAGYVTPDHWVHSEEEGGSRIIGEICHFVDMMQYLTGNNPERVYAERISGNNQTAVNSDNIICTLKFKDGSIGDITYSASGDKAFSRENIEIFFEGKTIVIKDYKISEFYSSGRKNVFKTFNQEMGYKEELQYFFDVISGKSEARLSPYEIFNSTLTVFKINESLNQGNPIQIIL